MGRKERRAAERAQRKAGCPPVSKPPAPRGIGAGNEILMTPERIQELKNEVVKEAVEQVKTMQDKRGERNSRNGAGHAALVWNVLSAQKEGVWAEAPRSLL